MLYAPRAEGVAWRSSQRSICRGRFTRVPLPVSLPSHPLRVDGQALARWILETDPYSMRNLIPGQIKLMFQAVDTMNTGYISFWGLCIL